MKLTGLDWLVIAAATVGLVVLVTWLVQGGQLPGRKRVTGVPDEK